MRPSSTRRSMPPSATVVPNALRSPRASIVAMASAFLLSRSTRRRGIEFLLRQAKPLNRGRNPRPFVRKEFLTFGLQHEVARASFDEHPETALRLDQLLVDQALVSFEDRKRVDARLGRDIAHRGQRVAFFKCAIEDHVHDVITKLPINRLSVVPFTSHPVFRFFVSTGDRSVRSGSRSTVVVKYNTKAVARLFCGKFFSAGFSAN